MSVELSLVRFVASVGVGWEPVDNLQKFVEVLLVVEIGEVVHSSVTEGQCAFCDVGAVVVVDCRCANPFVLVDISNERSISRKRVSY